MPIVTLKYRIQAIIKQSPFVLFFGALAALLGIIILTNFIRKPAAVEEVISREPKKVTEFIIGTDTTYTSASALIKKDSVQPIVALIAGTIETVTVRPGSHVTAASPLMRLSADYGTNTAGIATTLAERNQRFTENITRLDHQILDLEKKAARDDGTLSTTEENLALKRLKRERAAQNEALKTGALQVDLSRANESVFQPKSLVSGTVEHIAVQVGDFVTPGTLLAIIHTDSGSTALEVSVDASIAKTFDVTLASKCIVQTGEILELTPSYISKHETSDGLFIIRYLIPKTQVSNFTDGTRVSIMLPLHTPEHHSIVPIDAIFTHTDHASLFVNHNGIAEERTINIKSIFGQAALLTEELPQETPLILDRSIIAGEAVQRAR